MSLGGAVNDPRTLRPRRLRTAVAIASMAVIVGVTAWYIVQNRRAYAFQRDVQRSGTSTVTISAAGDGWLPPSVSGWLRPCLPVRVSSVVFSGRGRRHGPCPWIRRLPQHPRIEFLDLHGYDIRDADLVRLANLKDLRELNLSDTGMHGSGLAALEGMQALVDLRLAGTPLTGDGIASLPSLPNLLELDLSRTPVGDPEVRQLVLSPKLVNLNLDDTRLTDNGLRALAKLPDLNSLSLARTKITGAGIAHLARLKRLQQLDLSGNEIHDADLLELKKIPDLQIVAIQGCPVSVEGWLALEDAMPALIVQP